MNETRLGKPQFMGNKNTQQTKTRKIIDLKSGLKRSHFKGHHTIASETNYLPYLSFNPIKSSPNA